MLYKKFEEINIDDIKQLLTDSVQEGKQIEYKLILPERIYDGQKEFLADVSSFANTSGGYIIYGIEEEKGIPVKIIGIEIDDIDFEINRMESTIRNGIDPRIKVNIKNIQVVDEKQIIVIKINKSWISPHRVTLKGHDKFYARNSKGKYPLDTSELRTAFNMSYLNEEKIRRFRNERTDSLIYNEAPIAYNGKAKVILHLIPMDAFNQGIGYDLNSNNIISKLEPIQGGILRKKINFEGIISYAIDENDHSYSYIQLFRNGIIEAVDSFMLEINKANLIIPITAFEDRIMKVLRNYLGLLSDLNVTVPLFCFLTLTGIKGYKIHIQDIITEINKINNENLLLPEVIIDNYEICVGKILKPLFDLIWNACGLKGSYNIDVDGNWIKKG